jgi:hypothetical protein
MRRYR